VRSLAKQFGLPLCDRDRLKSFTDGERRCYFYDLSDHIKRHIMDQDPAVARRVPMTWKSGNSSNGSITFEPIVQSATPFAREIGLEPITMRGECRLIPR
jgi:hypothetical protein